jgi:hypothetical protein
MSCGLVLHCAITIMRSGQGQVVSEMLFLLQLMRADLLGSPVHNFPALTCFHVLAFMQVLYRNGCRRPDRVAGIPTTLLSTASNLL